MLRTFRWEPICFMNSISCRKRSLPPSVAVAEITWKQTGTKWTIACDDRETNVSQHIIFMVIPNLTKLLTNLTNLIYLLPKNTSQSVTRARQKKNMASLPILVLPSTSQAKQVAYQNSLHSAIIWRQNSQLWTLENATSSKEAHNASHNSFWALPGQWLSITADWINWMRLSLFIVAKNNKK